MQVDHMAALSHAFALKTQHQEDDSNVAQDDAQGNPFSTAVSEFGQQDLPNQLLNSLHDQKQRIIESKDNLVTHTLEQDGSLESIEKQLDHYEEQLQNIDQLISQTRSEEQQMRIKAYQRRKIQGFNSDSRNKTLEEMQNEKLISLSNLSASISMSHKISSEKPQVEGQENVVKNENAADQQQHIPSENQETAVQAAQTERVNKIQQYKDTLSAMSEQIDPKFPHTKA